MSVWETRDRGVLQHLVDNPPRHGMLWVETRSEQPRSDYPALSDGDF